jgi:hypothetical protein
VHFGAQAGWDPARNRTLNASASSAMRPTMGLASERCGAAAVPAGAADDAQAGVLLIAATTYAASSFSLQSMQ